MSSVLQTDGLKHGNRTQTGPRASGAGGGGRSLSPGRVAELVTTYGETRMVSKMREKPLVYHWF